MNSMDDMKCRAWLSEMNVILQMAENRQKSGDRIRANEFLVSVPRDKYLLMCEIVRDAMIDRITNKK